MREPPEPDDANVPPDDAGRAAGEVGGRMSRRAFLGVAGGSLALAGAAGSGVRLFLHRVNRVEPYPPAELARLRAGGSCPLLRRYPGLRRTVPWRPLGTFPTPVRELPLPHGSRAARLLLKDDGRTSPIYGGNKVRKLEHLLAEAELAGRTTLVTVGGLGTNHGLATAVHGARVGLRTELALYDQPLTPVVRKNYASLRASGAALHHHGSDVAALLGARRLLVEARERGESPRFINVGGSSRLGCAGYANGALELAEQIDAGLLPVPDRIFVALGTSGTAAGLAAGLRLAGIPSRVCGVRVTGLLPANRLLVRHFANDLLEWLADGDPDVPRTSIALDDFDVLGDHLGPGYGAPTPECEAAVRWAGPGLRLETTYTGKALAACLEHCRSRAGEGETLLFWNTWSGTDPPLARELPEP